MKSFAATEAKTNFGALLDAAQRAPVAIRKNGRRVAFVLSQECFEDYAQLKLDELHRKLQEGIDQADRGELVDGAQFMAGLAEKYSDE
jgi:prevent-host-death family protein